MQKKKFLKLFEKKYLKHSNNSLNSTKQIIVKCNKLDANYFFNTSFDKGRLKNFVWWFLKKYGQKKTIDLLEDLKNLGFGYATLGGISLGIDDLQIPPTKSDLLFRADFQIKRSNFRYKRAEITGVEQFQQLIDTWHQTSETLKQDVIKYFELTDIFNPVYMMAFSGARGNVSQVRQLVGMRGLMADPQGQIIDFPIRSNFREGLTLTEYIISTYGARKGIVDTALRTATAGYLTRRLVDVAQHVVISQFDCGTIRGIFLFDMKEGIKTLYSFKDRLIGRILAQDIFDYNKFDRNSSLNCSQLKIASRNQEISADLAVSIAKITKKALVRSPLTCETRRLVCQLCYGWSLSKGSLVSLGEAVGVIAAQSIGEPGTQLTMRTFHTGGVFSGGITDQIIALEDGIVYYSNPIPGTCIRTPQGEIAFLTKVSGSFLFKKESCAKSKSIEQFYKVPAYTILFVRHQQKVYKKQILAQFSALSKQQAIQADAEQIIYSKLEGQIYFSHLDLMEQSHEKYGDITWKTDNWAKVWILSGKVYENPIGSYFFPKAGDLITKKTTMNQIEWYTPKSCIVEKSLILNELRSLKNSFNVDSLTNFSKHIDEAIFNKNKQVYFKRGLKKTDLYNDNKILNSKITNIVKIKPFKLILNSNLHIFSKRLMKLKFKKVDLLSNNKNKFYRGSSVMKTIHFKQNWDQILRLKIKVASLKLPFYYPFQQLSFKRLISFLAYGTQKELILQKQGFSSQNLFFEFKLKKINKNQKNKLSLTDLQKKWQPWFKTNHADKIVRKKTIQGYFEKNDTSYLKMRILNEKKPRAKAINIQKILNKTLSLKSNLKVKNIVKSIPNEEASIFSLSIKKNFLKTGILNQVTNKKFNDNNLVRNSKLPNFSFLSKNKTINVLNLGNLSQTSFQKVIKKQDLLLKSPLLFFNLNNLSYKKVSYILSLKKNNDKLTNVTILKNETQDKHLFSKKHVELNIDFNLSKKIQFLALCPLNKNFFTENIQIKDFSRESTFSPQFNLMSRTLKNQNLELQNTFGWSNFSTNLLSWFPQEYQTANNGIFFISGLFSSFQHTSQIDDNYFNILFQVNKKSLKNYEKIVKLNTVYFLTLPVLNYFIKSNFDNIQVNTFLSSKIQYSFTEKNIEFSKIDFAKNKDFLNSIKIKKSKYYYNIFNFKKLHQIEKKYNFEEINFDKKKFLNNIQITNKNKTRLVKISNYLNQIHSKNKYLLTLQNLIKFSTNYNKNSSVRFFKIKSINSALRWNNKKFVSKLSKKDVKSFSNQNFVKYNLNFNEIFWLPQENYEFSNMILNTESDLLKKSMSKEKNFNNLQILPRKSHFLQNQKILLILSNRQGLKKPVLSNLEGFSFLSLKSSQARSEKTNENNVGHLENVIYQKEINLKILNHQNFNSLKPKLNINIKNRNLTNKILNSSGITAIKTIKSVLKKNLISAILKSQKKKLEHKKIQTIFTKKLKQTQIVNKLDFINNNLVASTFLDNSLDLQKKALDSFPIQKILLEQKKTKHKFSTKDQKFFNVNNLKLGILPSQITIKQGWIYLTTNFSKINFLHQTIIEPGILFLNNISFDHYRLFIEILPIDVQKSFVEESKIELKEKFSSKINILNKKSRFGKNFVSKGKSIQFAILIRPMHFKISKNPETFKKQIYKLNTKHCFSLITLNKFYYNSLNQQQPGLKLLPSFPSPDIIISPKLNLLDPNTVSFKNCDKGISLIKEFGTGNMSLKVKNKQNLLINKYPNNEKVHLQNSKLPPIFYKFPINLLLTKYFVNSKVNNNSSKIKNFISNSQNLKQRSESKDKNSLINILQNQFFSITHDHFYGSFSEYSYYSAYSMNFNPILIQGSIPLNQHYFFKIPLVYFNKPQKLNSFNLLTNINNTLNFLSLKNFYFKNSGNILKKDFKLEPVNLINPLISETILNSKNQTVLKLEKTQKIQIKSEQLFQIQFLKLQFLVPVLDFSYSEKMNYLYNERFFDYEKIEDPLSLKLKNKNTFFKQMPLDKISHSIPKINNKIFVYNDNHQNFSNQTLAKTCFISLLDGEIITKQTNFNFQKHTDFSPSFEGKTTQHLILTKSDLVTVYLMDSTSTDKNKTNTKEIINSLINPHKIKIHLPFKQNRLLEMYTKILETTNQFQRLEQKSDNNQQLNNFELKNFVLKYQHKIYKINGLKIGQIQNYKKLRLAKFLVAGDPLYSKFGIETSGQIIHLNSQKLTIRIGEYFSASPYAILHSYNREFIKKNTAVMTLPFQTLKTGDIVQGIPKVEQYLEARTTQQGRLFVRSLPVLMQAIFERYCTILSHEKAVRQSLLKIQQILVDGVQRVYRSQGISIADKHLEIIVKQMTSKVQIIFGGQTGLFPGELVDLDFVERINRRVLIKIYYEPIILGITRSSLEVESFLSAASFQQTTKILARAAIYKQKDYLKGLKENLLIGNLIPAGTGYIMISKY